MSMIGGTIVLAIAFLVTIVKLDATSVTFLGVFFVSLLIGKAGAGVFVVVQLFAEGKTFIEKLEARSGLVPPSVMLASFFFPELSWQPSRRAQPGQWPRRTSCPPS